MSQPDVLKTFKSEQLVLALVDRDLSSLSEDLKCIVLFQIGCSLHESLQAESKKFTTGSKNLTDTVKLTLEVSYAVKIQFFQ